MSTFNKAQVAAILTYGGAWLLMFIVGWPSSALGFFMGWSIAWCWLCVGHIYSRHLTPPGANLNGRKN
jgi:hypothetical protein